MTINRALKTEILKDLKRQSGVVLLGPRQVGKTTLAQQIAEETNAVYLDLEYSRDRQKLSDPHAFLERHRGTLVILDEVQSMPDLFMELRGAIDKGRKAGQPNGQLLLLGSASQVLLRQSSQSLLGRVSYHELSGVGVHEIDHHSSIEELWLRGGYPDSFLANNDDDSLRARRDIVRSLIDRDIPQIAGSLDQVAVERFFELIATLQGDEFVASRVARVLDFTTPTAIKYVNTLTDLMVLRTLKPWYGNGVKRVTQKPKVYIRDSGLLHYVLGISDHDALLGHFALGRSWEGFVIEQVINNLDHMIQPFFFRQQESEVDLVLERAGRYRIAIEVKHSGTPKMRKGFFKACEIMKATHKIVIHGGKDSFPTSDGVEAMSLTDAIAFVQEL